MPLLTPGDWVTLLGMAGTALAAFIAVREQTKGLKEGQNEMLRQLVALHARLDSHGAEIVRIDKDYVRLDERIKFLGRAKMVRFRPGQPETQPSGEGNMFLDEDC